MEPRLMSYLHCFNVLEDYFECHEYGESLWLDSGRPQILKGLIQTAVCIYHLQGGNVRGGFRMWTRARRYLSQYLQESGPVYEGIDIQALFEEMDQMWSYVPVSWRSQTLHRDRVTKLHLPKVSVHLVSPELEERVRTFKPILLPE